MRATGSDQAAPDPLMLSVSGARGIVGRTMTPPVAATFAAAFGMHLQQTVRAPRVCIGRDGRPSGDLLGRAALSGLAAIGCDVVDLGIVTTPTVGLMVRELGADGGLMLTASHNPGQWNGLKCIRGDGCAPAPEEATAIIERFRSGAIDYVTYEHLGAISADDRGHDIHVERVLAGVDVDRIRAAAFTVVLDSVNGAGCVGGRRLLDRLGCRTIHLHGEPTGVFPHPPEPTEGNLIELARRTAAEGAAIGFAQDPDADRLAIIDEGGRYIGEEYTLVLAAKRRFDTAGGGPAVTNLSTSRGIDDLAARYPSGSVHRTAVGEAHVAAAMQTTGAIIGGEGNGGVVDPSIGWIRDSLAAMALVLDLLAAEDAPLSAIVEDLPAYVMVKRKADLAAVGGAEAVPAALARVAEAYKDADVDTVDGVRIDLPEGWVHLRPSNTEPIIRLIAEAATEEAANRLARDAAAAAGLSV